MPAAVDVVPGHVGSSGSPWRAGHGGNELIVDLIRKSAARESRTPGSTYTIVRGCTTAFEVACALGRLICAPDAAESLEAEVVTRELPTALWMAGDIAVDPVWARSELGWDPQGPGLVDEIEGGSYLSSKPREERR